MKENFDVEIVLENCESITFSNKKIKYLSIMDLNTSLDYVGYGPLCKMVSCKSFEIIIKKEANVDYYAFDMKDYKSTKFKRILSYDDITQIWINGEHFFVPWKDGQSEYENEYQKSWIDKNGNLHIEIKKTIKKVNIKN